MSDNEKLLSICIPTYNQPFELRRTLNSLLNQDLEGVEVIIRDDSNNKDSEVIVEGFVNKLPIRYFHLKKEGIDPAFIFLSREAKGKFVWWFGDDIFSPSVVLKVVDLLKKNTQLDFVYINSTDLTGDHYSISAQGNHFYINRTQVLLELKDQLGFCSACLFERTKLVSGLLDSEKFIGTSWVTLFLVLNTLTLGKNFYFLDGKNFLSDIKPSGEVRWYDQIQVFGINFPRILMEFSDKFEFSAIQGVIRSNLRRVIKAIFAERGMGLKTGFAVPFYNFPLMFKMYWRYWEIWVAFPIFILPRKINIIFYKLYKKLKTIRHDK
ncbi:MAG: glycosyltransferase family 2 protein [Candidatus Shapirobacteria bacterium]|jgi:glycosyltransferase involved in cell wall biosynthesis